MAPVSDDELDRDQAVDFENNNRDGIDLFLTEITRKIRPPRTTARYLSYIVPHVKSFGEDSFLFTEIRILE